MKIHRLRRLAFSCSFVWSLEGHSLTLSVCHFREEHSMDQCRSRPKLSENFEGHWSIPFPGEIHMDQSLVHTFSWGNSYGPMVLKVLQKFPPTLVLVHGWLFPAFAPRSTHTFMKSWLEIPWPWYKCQNSQNPQKWLRRVQKVIWGLSVESPKKSLSHRPNPVSHRGNLPKKGFRTVQETVSGVSPQRPENTCRTLP